MPRAPSAGSAEGFLLTMVLTTFIRRTGSWRSKSAAYNVKSPSQKPQAILYGERPSAWGTLGGARLCRGHSGRGHGAGAVEFRPSRRRLLVFAGHLGRSGRLRADVRALPQVPRLELQRSYRAGARRGVLAQ